MKTLEYLLFPPLCLECKERTPLAYLCEKCWQRSALADLMGRCQHCFEPMDEPFGLCRFCKKSPALPFARAAVFEREAPVAQLVHLEESAEAMAGFAYYQWLKLQWSKPDFVIPVGRASFARGLAQLFEVPCVPLLVKVGAAEWEIRTDWDVDDSGLLMVDDGFTPVGELYAMSRAIQEAFPKRLYLLRLLA